MNYIIDTKVGAMVYIILTTVYFLDLTYVFILKNIYTTIIQYYRLVNLWIPYLTFPYHLARL